jgi:hypothetical protein
MGKKIISIVVMLCFISFVIPNSESTDERTVTFVKYLPNGERQLFTGDVEIEEGETVSHAIARRCAELMKEDAAIQLFIEQQLGLNLIISAGDGMHFALPPALLTIPLLQTSFTIFPSIIYCSYSGADASTDIIPLPLGETTSFSGDHKVLAIGFVGIIGWNGIFSFSSTGFAGLTVFAWGN